MIEDKPTFCWSRYSEAQPPNYPALRTAARDRSTYFRHIPRDIIDMIERLVAPISVAEMIWSLGREPPRLALLPSPIRDQISSMYQHAIAIDIWFNR